LNVLWNSYTESYDNLMTCFYPKIDLGHKIVLWNWPMIVGKINKFSNGLACLMW
jgi:hypothetical protein